VHLLLIHLKWWRRFSRRLGWRIRSDSSRFDSIRFHSWTSHRFHFRFDSNNPFRFWTRCLPSNLSFHHHDTWWRCAGAILRLFFYPHLYRRAADRYSDFLPVLRVRWTPHTTIMIGNSVRFCIRTTIARRSKLGSHTISFIYLFLFLFLFLLLLFLIQSIMVVLIERVYWQFCRLGALKASGVHPVRTDNKNSPRTLFSCAVALQL